MTSGFWIAISVPIGLLIFIAWELIQLQRRRRGNRSARTKSQYVIHRIEAGSNGWKWYGLLFPIFIALVGVWLFFHFQGPCYWSFFPSWMCELGEKL